MCWNCMPQVQYALLKVHDWHTHIVQFYDSHTYVVNLHARVSLWWNVWIDSVYHAKTHSVSLTGTLRPDHVQRYSELGAWLTECYSTSIASQEDIPVPGNNTVLHIPVPAGATVDRISLRENQTLGQRIYGFTIGAAGTPPMIEER